MRAALAAWLHARRPSSLTQLYAATTTCPCALVQSRTATPSRKKKKQV